MPLMQEAIPREDWEAMDRGERVPKRKSTPRPEPAAPKIAGQISVRGVDFQRLMSIKRDNRRNSTGMMFIGFQITLEAKEKGTAGVKTLSGWIPEVEWLELLRVNRDKINVSMLQVM